jgi:hypothetical protein
MKGRAAPEDLSSGALEAVREAAMGRASKLEEVLEGPPVEAFEALLSVHAALHDMESLMRSQIMLNCVWKALGKLNPRVVSSRLHLLWETLLQTENCRASPSLVSGTLASLLGQETPVPAWAARSGKERGDDLGLALWLLSAEPDVPEGVLQMLETSSRYSDLVECVKVAVARHAVDVMPQIRRDIATRSDNLWHSVRYLGAAGLRCGDEPVFSEAEWSFILSDLSLMEPVALSFRRDKRRPTPLVEAYLARVRSSGGQDASMLSHFGHWLTREEADQLVALYDGHTFQSGYKDVCLGALVARSWASRDVRFAVLRKRLGKCADFHWNFESGGVDWGSFDDSQLLELIDGWDGVLGQAAMAQELCRRKLEPKQLRAIVRDRLSAPTPLTVAETFAMCCYAVHDTSMFDTLQLDAEQQTQPGDRAVVYAAVGRWKREVHPYLLRQVQAVALTTLWALSRRMGTRYLVYKVLEMALRPPADGPLCTTGLPRVRSVVGLLRQK